MMSDDNLGWIEATGDSVEEAIDKALREACLDREAAEIEVVARPLVGRLFGAKAKVRVRPKEGLSPEVVAPSAARIAEEFLRGLLDAFGIAAEVDTAVEDSTVRARIEGDNLGILIGYRGQTMAALAELTRTVVARRVRAKVHVDLDIGNYRHRRHEALARFAREQARRALEEGIEVSLKPMNAAERKVVHEAAKDVSGVRTYSEGKEPNRFVVISPVAAGEEEPDAEEADAVGD
jgi:spoIIIJ-associated protein